MTLLLGDCLLRLKELPENSVDSIVTDPPYGIRFMGKAWDGADIEKVLKRDKSEGDTKTSISMAAGKYDLSNKGMIAFQEFSFQWAKECLRVLKPGGHLLAFASCRTYHRMAVGVEMAGFEIRDQIQWLFGSGFPKSHDVSKAIDKQAGVERKVIGQKDVGPDMRGGNFKTSENRMVADITLASTAAAKQWVGWGTALKPANEPIVVARKPLEKGLTIAQNVMKWGTGALNIDASRIGTERIESGRSGRSGQTGFCTPKQSIDNKQFVEGRWPANVIFDEDAAEALDLQSGNLPGPWGKNGSGDQAGAGSMFKIGGVNSQNEIRGKESGGASRFFYVAKASKRERNAGLEGEVKEKQGARPNSKDASGKFPDHDHRETGGNNHPTVKPIKLMKYLITLVTPHNGSVLDPFMGSGSTGVAAKSLGREFIGIELNEEYFAIAQNRIALGQSLETKTQATESSQLEF